MSSVLLKPTPSLRIMRCYTHRVSLTHTASLQRWLDLERGNHSSSSLDISPKKGNISTQRVCTGAMLNPGLTTEDWPQGKSLKTAKSYRNTHKIHTSKLMTLGKAVKILKGVIAWTTNT